MNVLDIQPQVYRILRTADGNPTGLLQANLIDPSLRQSISFQSPDDWAIEEPVRYGVLQPFADITDIPVENAGFPLVSRRYAEALTRLGGFDCRLYDVLLVDNRGEPTEGAEDFVLFHVRTVVALIDREYYDELSPDIMAQGKICLIRDLVLRGEAMVPPCFFIDQAKVGGPFVSIEGKAALSALPPRGFRFEVVSTFSGH